MIGLAELLGVTVSLPDMPHADCREHLDVFDSTAEGDIKAAVGVCHGCPALKACSAWSSGLPKSQLRGTVVAGRYRAYPSGHKKRTA